MKGLDDLPQALRAKILVDEETGCWRWQGSLSYLYGQVRWKGKTQRAHRVVFELLRNKIPKGLTLDHFLRNQDELACVKSCVNPDHLEAVSDRENKHRSPRFRAAWLRDYKTLHR